METDFSDYSQATTSGPDFSSSSMGLSDEAMASIGSSQNQNQSFFGGPDYNVMDYGRGSVTNVTNSPNYDPNFAALSMIGRGLTPGFNLRNKISFDVPASMLPQIEGKYGPIGPKYYSPVERTLVEMEPIGIMSVIGKGLSSLFGGIDFLNNSKAGSTVEEEVAKEEEKQNQLATSFMDPAFMDQLDPAFMDVDRTKAKDSGASLAVDPNLSPDFVSRMRSIDALPAYSAVPQPVIVNQLQRDLQRDIAKSRGIFDLPQAADLQNNQIAAGSSTGQALSAGPMSGGYTLSPISSTGKAEDKALVQGPPQAPDKAPPGFVDIVMGEDKTPRFAGTNMSIYGGKGPGDSFKPKNELEAQAAIDAGFSLAPFTPMFEKTFNPGSYTKDLTPLGITLPAAEFRVNRQPEVATRFKVSDLPREVQEVVSLRSDLDYDKSFPLQTILDARRSVNEGEFSQKEMGDFLAGFSR